MRSCLDDIITPGAFATECQRPDPVLTGKRHTGGTLVVKHRDVTKNLFKSNGPDSQNLQSAAFFADCTHELKPIETGAADGDRWR